MITIMTTIGIIVVVAIVIGHTILIIRTTGNQWATSVALFFNWGLAKSGKAADFDSAIQRFESFYPSQC